MVEVVGLLDCVEGVESPFVQHACTLADGLDDLGIVGDQDKCPVFAFLEQLVGAAIVKALVARHHGLVDQKAIELDRHRKGERQACQHAL